MSTAARLLGFPCEMLSRLPVVGGLVRAACTSVGQKLLMAVTGLSLCGFLVAHLGGNLLLFAGEEKFNAYAATLHSYGPLLTLAEIGLFTVFVLHLFLAISTAAMNRAARASSYEMTESKQDGVSLLPGGGASYWMFGTGVMIALFIAVHLVDLRIKANPLHDYSSAVQTEAGSEVPIVNEFRAVRIALTGETVIVYVVGLLALGIHLTHGVRSALQTLGVNHRTWNPLLKLGGILFAWGIALGFMSIVAWAWLVEV